MSGKKKKNTYVVELENILFDFKVFSATKNTPLPVVKINGRPVQSQTGWMKSQPFPTEPAQVMIREHKTLTPIMGPLATTVIEYLDKETNQPIVHLFPSTISIHGDHTDDYMTRLNHASRQDLMRQIKRRQELMMKSGQINKQR